MQIKVIGTELKTEKWHYKNIYPNTGGDDGAG
jgi:hypothetical protein